MTNIGIFDSGLGGLTVLSELTKNTEANYYYLGDSLRAPYGSRDKDEIIHFSEEIVEDLEAYDIDTYVIACNTISVLATDHLSEKYHKDFYPITTAGVEAALDFEGDFLLLATKTTVESHFYKNFIEDKSSSKVYEVAAEELVGLIEAGKLSGEELDGYLDEYLKIAKEKKIPNIILGCTHFPLIREAIEKNLAYEANIINPAEKIVEKIECKQKSSKNINIFMTKITENTTKVIDKLITADYNLELKEI